MQAIKCELCGGGDLVKQDGMFVCQHCGTKYTLEEARKLLGTVKIDKTDVKDNNKNISAYKWAYENKLVTARKLRSADNCTRAEMATFLYEYNNTYKVVK